MKKMLLAIICILVAIPIGVYAFVHSKPFGSLPKGERLERVLNSSNYRDGAFRNEEPTTLMVQNEEGARQGRFKTMWNFVFGKKPEGRVPEEGEVTVVKSDLRGLYPQEDVYVWLGH
ncbi:MAG: MBL fold metallo-hydrolase, partial [Bacteroidales bacterium]|nr:MBL fold metallo-hydrolase [Bacteroidales bacterium]